MKKIVLALLFLQTLFLQKISFAEESFYWFNSCSSAVEDYGWSLNNAANIQDGVLYLSPSGNWCSTKKIFTMPSMTLHGMLKFEEGEGAFQMALGSGNEMIWNWRFEKKSALKGAVWKSQIQRPINDAPMPESEYSAEDFPFDTWLPLSMIKNPKGIEVWLNHKMVEKTKGSPPEMPIAFRATGLLNVEADEFEVRSISSDTRSLDDLTLEKSAAFPEGWTQRSGVWSTVLLPKMNVLAVCQSMESHAELGFVEELIEGSSISAKVRFEGKGQVGLGLIDEKTGLGLRVLIRKNEGFGVVGESLNAGTALMSFRSSAQIFPGLWYNLNLHCRRGLVAVELNGTPVGEMDCQPYGRPYLVSDGAPSALFREVKISGLKKLNKVSLPTMAMAEVFRPLGSTTVPPTTGGDFDDLNLELGNTMVLSTLLIDHSELFWKMGPREKGGQLSFNGLDEGGQKILASLLDFTEEAKLKWTIQSPTNVPVMELKREGQWVLGLQRIGQKLLLIVDAKEVGQVTLPNDCGPIFIEWGRVQGDFSFEHVSYGWTEAQIFDLWNSSKHKSATRFWNMNIPSPLKTKDRRSPIKGPLGTMTLKEQLGLNHRVFLQSRDAQSLPQARRHVVEWTSESKVIRVVIVLLDDGCDVQWTYNDSVIGRKRLRTSQMQLLAGFDAQKKFRVWISGESLGEAQDVGSGEWKFVLRPETEASDHYWHRVLWYNR